MLKLITLTLGLFIVLTLLVGHLGLEKVLMLTLFGVLVGGITMRVTGEV